jgi:hypothetical protein
MINNLGGLIPEKQEQLKQSFMQNLQSHNPDIIVSQPSFVIGQ